MRTDRGGADITCTGPQIWDTDLLLCGHERWADLIGADLGRRPVAVPLADPALVVGLPKGAEGRPRLLDGREVADPQQVLLQGPDEALGTAVAFGLAHERRRALDTQEADLGLEVVADVLAPVIAAKLEADGDVVGKRAKALAHRLLDRLERLKTLGAATGPPPAVAGGPCGHGSTALRSMGTDACGRALGRLLPAVPAGTDHRRCR